MKWFKYKPNVQVRNMVLTAARQTHKYARVISMHNGADGMVQSVDIEHKLHGEENFG